MSSKEGGLRAEIRQNKPFRSRQQEALLGLLRTAALIRRNDARLMEPAGISPEQYNVLRILRGAGREGLPTLDIVERMIEPSPAITRLLDKLESKGLVRRVRCAKDRRQVLCTITASGLELLARLDEPVDKAAKDAIKLGREDLDQLIRLLDRVRAAWD
jgi:DNA-binding MarR family transcriptional regulator